MKLGLMYKFLGNLYLIPVELEGKKRDAFKRNGLFF
jgi:hypothetical protein